MQFQKATTYIPPRNDLVQSTDIAVQEQGKQSFISALAEVEELKQAIRYLEITITKSKEKNEKLTKEYDIQVNQNEVSLEESDSYGSRKSFLKSF